jgi:hypothetical protein
VSKFSDYKTDGRGLLLCRACWNGAHYIKWEASNEIGKPKPKKVIVDKPAGAHLNCLQGKCQCPCVALETEKPKRVTRREREEYTKQFQADLFQ